MSIELEKLNQLLITIERMGMIIGKWDGKIIQLEKRIKALENPPCEPICTCYECTKDMKI